ncbi:peptidylprolyl isomerase [Oleiphilus sp. HI0081]|jgi:FKBP-type peptidyl-prolyl cis-trans isomerase FklB|nr:MULTISPECIES: FKBP-type peptidyl-prolyl cis-trans isomerase [unclassified Oleiphilus]KZY50037.1 peptidylprolyl isomerase [Oleiphilus sp. HI0050]KZY75359.1 peptidylprolyl isomerase [Oleiphilus sp. HI0068]KZY77709.1 peptidylprolyl isomerase [Oleiphilus sp. HI0069]KZY85088.1 peptidylprolyl isomerase [Oleiphilus sp. HI0072]KZZ17996.1 peptidylprolyl isomerase [Oleiphilus sp. HI0078]KZZ21605.1 peptidylprolyl isomerase [Oleiphilus sp. HI0081]
MSDLDLSTNEAKASYGVGLQMGQQLANVFNGLSLEAAIAGINDAFSGKGPQIPGEEINAAFQVIQTQVEAEKQEQAKKFAGEGEAFLAENAKRDEVTVLESGLQYEVITAGEGDIPTAESVVSTHYRGTLIDGKQFDSSYDRGEPAQFPVGGVIAGWTEALQQMKVGSKWKLYIPYHLAYGEAGAGADIGPYQALVFDIELLEIVG